MVHAGRHSAHTNGAGNNGAYDDRTRSAGHPRLARRPEWIASIVAAVLITSGVGAAAAGPPSPEPPPDGNLVVNGTFDDGVDGWHGNASTGMADAAGQEGGHALALRNIASTPRSVVLNDRVDTVAATIAGHTYRATASVRVPQPEQSAVIRLREWGNADGTSKAKLIGQSLNHDWLSSTDWHRIAVEYTAKTDGASLDLNLVAYSLGVGHRIDVDNVTLYDVTLGSGEEPTGPVVQPRPTPEITPPPEPPDPEPGTAPAPSTLPGGWILSFSDEFSGTEVNRDNWAVLDHSTYGDGNNELACLMDRPENVAVADGVLTITAQSETPPLVCGDRDARFPGGRDYSSAFLDSGDKASFEYGRFEVRVKTPNSHGNTKGLWPAFWLRPDDGGLGEIDVFEIIGTSPGDPDTSSRTTQSIHYDYVKTHPKQNKAYDLPKGNFADGFHTHAVEWGPGSLRWYVDGVLTYERTTETTPWLDQAFSGPFHLRLNMAVGGNWTGSPDANTQLPADFQVDYVRVYQQPK